MELCRKGSGWGLGTGSSLEGGQALEWAPQGTGHSPRLLAFNKCLDSALRHRVWILGGPV